MTYLIRCPRCNIFLEWEVRDGHPMPPALDCPACGAWLHPRIQDGSLLVLYAGTEAMP